MVEYVPRSPYFALAGLAPDTPDDHARHLCGVCSGAMTDVRAEIGEPSSGLLGDSTARDYADKLSKFNAYAKPELRRLIKGLDLRPGMRVLDAGCGTGEALNWLRSEVTPSERVVGVDLAAAHVAAAKRHVPPDVQIRQGNLFDALFEPASFDLVWCVNTINHLTDPVAGVIHLATLLRHGGRVALGQSSFLPDMYFAWDARLERVTSDAVRRYYQDRYHIDEHDLKAVRALLGILRQAALRNVTVCTVMIERAWPLDGSTESYLRETIFRDTWGERLRPYLSADDYQELARLCNPRHADYALRRHDFHFLQSFTLATGEI
jgi:SAM-dependent methyltransferase